MLQNSHLTIFTNCVASTVWIFVCRTSDNILGWNKQLFRKLCRIWSFFNLAFFLSCCYHWVEIWRWNVESFQFTFQSTGGRPKRNEEKQESNFFKWRPLSLRPQMCWHRVSSQEQYFLRLLTHLWLLRKRESKFCSEVFLSIHTIRQKSYK